MTNNDKILDFECPDCKGKWQITTDSNHPIRPANLLCFDCGSKRIGFTVRKDIEMTLKDFPKDSS